MPGEGLNLADASVVSDLFQRAAEANLNESRRSGSVIDLPDKGDLLITGDLHDHGPNFLKAVKLAKLHASPDRHLILHELVHGPHRVNGRDMSVRLLARAAALKLDYPEQVHVLQSNHELAQMLGEGILKDGASVVEAFDEGVDYLYQDDAERVTEAVHAFIRSLPLAVRCANGVMVTHSLPGKAAMKSFDPTIIDRQPTDADLDDEGSAYLMVWGRRHTDALVDELAEAWGVELFVMGHQPAEMGYEMTTSRSLILASDHEHGMALPIDLAASYEINDLVMGLVPLASLPG